MPPYSGALCPWVSGQPFLWWKLCPLSNLSMDKLFLCCFYAFLLFFFVSNVCKFYQVLQELSQTSYEVFQRLKRCFLNRDTAHFTRGREPWKPPGEAKCTSQHCWSCMASSVSRPSGTVTGSDIFYRLLHCPFERRCHRKWQCCFFRPNLICFSRPVALSIWSAFHILLHCPAPQR